MIVREQARLQCICKQGRVRWATSLLCSLSCVTGQNESISEV